MCRYRGVGLVESGINQGIAGEAEYRGAVGEEIDVLRTDDVHPLERRLAFDERGSLRGTLTLHLAYG
jgi:hypothetical protein